MNTPIYIIERTGCNDGNGLKFVAAKLNLEEAIELAKKCIKDFK